MQPENTVPTGLIIIDVQGKLATAVQDATGLRERVVALLKLCNLQQRPVLVCEQMPDKLGKTDPFIMDSLSTPVVHEKDTFNAMMNSGFAELVKKHRHWAVTGIEAHICVYQTVLGMLEQNRKVSVLADATSSRNPGDRQIGLAGMARCGASMVSTELLLYQWMGNAKNDVFRAMLPTIKALPPYERGVE